LINPCAPRTPATTPRVGAITFGEPDAKLDVLEVPTDLG
jgi:hypothetical protein